MSCNHPLRGFPVGLNPSGKTQYKITDFQCEAVCRRKHSNDPWNNCDPGFSDPRYEVIKDSVLIPCGQCGACRLQYSREWADRLMMELPYHEHAWFLTLTYDDRHVPTNSVADLYSGLVHSVNTLRPRDLTLFWKRLRREFPDTHITYFASGEYGDMSFRPHYHAIVFGPDIPDLKLYKYVRGHTYMTSELLNRLWSDAKTGESRGYVVVGEVTWQSCAYVARYCMKKVKGYNRDLYEFAGLEPEFCRMSKNPAIGRQFYFDHPDLMFFNRINLSTMEKGISFKPPRYFDKLFELDYPSQYATMKAVRREVADGVLKQILKRTDLDALDYFSVQESLQDDVIKKLIRSDF